MRLKKFVSTHWDPKLYPQVSDREGWLARLSLPQKFPKITSIIGTAGATISFSVNEIKESVHSIYRYYTRPGSKEDSSMKQFTIKSIMSFLDTPGMNPTLHPYFLANEKHPFADLMEILRSTEDQSFVDQRIAVSDMTRSTVLLFSARLALTAWHFDWSQAINVALEVQVGDVPCCWILFKWL